LVRIYFDDLTYTVHHTVERGLRLLHRSAFWQLQPFDGVTGERAVALAEPGKVYAVYLPQVAK